MGAQSSILRETIRRQIDTMTSINWQSILIGVTRMARYLGNHAVVLGGSVAGSLAARVLSDYYQQVTLVDRDSLFGTDGPRHAVPQGHHIHALLARGQQILDELFPGFTAELTSIGVPVGDFGTSLSWYFNGRMIEKAETGLTCVAAGRPLLESRLRNRVKALGNVTYREHTDIVDLVASPGGDRITGVRVQAHDATQPETIEADLVVDATGRGTRMPKWLEQLGYPAVPQERVKMELTYTTCDFHGPLSFDPIGDDIALLPVATPQMPRGAIFARLPDRYAISLTGILGDKPPTDMAGFMEYVKSLPVPEIYKAVRDAEPMAPPATFHFPASIRRRYERMSRLPDGLLAIGDAAAVFNPVYGQGMTVAAIGTTVLGKHLAAGVPQPRAYFRDLAKIIDAPWDMSAGADLGFPGVEGRRTVKTKMGNLYIPRLQAAAASDGALSAAFLRTAGLVDPPTALMKPSIIARVFRAKR
jgi:2-polyprenyl-6-methoxyphenol hydroxylase-like FAD-dependent oxidoreductase